MFFWQTKTKKFENVFWLKMFDTKACAFFELGPLLKKRFFFCGGLYLGFWSNNFRPEPGLEAEKT